MILQAFRNMALQSYYKQLKRRQKNLTVLMAFIDNDPPGMWGGSIEKEAGGIC